MFTTYFRKGNLFRNQLINFSKICISTVFLLSCSSSNKSSMAASDRVYKYETSPVASQLKNNLIRFQFRKGEITKLCQSAREDLLKKIDTQTQSAFDFDRYYADFSDLVSPLTFMAYVSTNKNLRDEGSACEESVSKLTVELYTRRSLYELIRKTKTNNDNEARLVSELKRQFELNGMALSDKKLEEVKNLKTELSALETRFTKHLNENKTNVVFSKEQLVGAPDAFLKRLKRTQDGRYIVTTKQTDYIQTMENVKIPETRRKMQFAYETIGGESNQELLEKAILLRAKIAKVMGYKKWADYRIEGRMAQNSSRALKLLNDLKEKLGQRLDSDLSILLKAKKEMQDPSATKLDPWDVRYFAYQVKKRDYSLDDEVIREYFPKDVVMKGLFEVYSTLLHVQFEEVKGAPVWSPDVKLYSVREKSSDEILAYFYTDFVPREGKYGHAAAFPLISGRVVESRYYSQPVSAIVSNFTPPANGRPSLLTHDEVETLFHEFGHIMHQTLTRAPYAFLSGTSTAQDFVEAPSQMLENWVWNADMLRKISGHYKDVNKKLPDELIKKMIAAKNFNQGYHYSRQLLLGLIDLTMHTSNDPVDTSALFKELHKEILHIDAIGGSKFMAGFGHMMGGYDAGYYGYIWSEVFAQDMFTKFESAGLLSEQVGLQYRRAILEKGNMEEPMDLIAQFLDRKPNNKAFLRKLGL